MAGVSYSWNPETDFVDPNMASYVYYPCEYCGNKFQLVEPENNFQAGGAVRTYQWRYPKKMRLKRRRIEVMGYV